MSAFAKLNITVLLDHELRAAAHALTALRNVDKDDREALGVAVDRLLATVHAALYHLALDERDEYPVTIAAVPPVHVTLVKREAPADEKKGGTE